MHKVRQNYSAYQKAVRIYSGEKPAEDDPKIREKCRELFVQRLNGKKILEVGCGSGVDSNFLQKMNLDVTATDFSEEFVKIVLKDSRT